MIQDILPLHMENQYVHKKPTNHSRLMVFWENQILIKSDEELDFLTYGEVESWCEENQKKVPQTVYLFSIGEQDYFLTEVSDELVGNIGAYHFVRMFEVRARKPKEQVFAAATAWHLYVWYRDNQFCGRCGKKLVHSKDIRMLFCVDCGNQVFPKIAPAVIVGVTNGEQILMTKYAKREYKRYALIAGFTEIGETAEETVAREVMEEVGLRVKNIRYYKSQPWGFDSNLLLGYFCELDDSKGVADILMDEEELSEAEWVHYSEVPDDPEGLSLTREMMQVFKNRQNTFL